MVPAAPPLNPGLFAPLLHQAQNSVVPISITGITNEAGQLVAHGLIGINPFSAPITLTGNVETDFNTLNSEVWKTPVNSDPTKVGVAPFLATSGWVSGWAIKDIRTTYDAKTDKWLTLAPMPAGRHATAAVTDGDHVYLAGGSLTPGGAGATNQLIVFTLP